MTACSLGAYVVGHVAGPPAVAADPRADERLQSDPSSQGARWLECCRGKNLCVCVRVCPCACVCVCACACMRVAAKTCACERVWPCARACMRTRVCVRACVRARARVCACVRAYHRAANRSREQGAIRSITIACPRPRHSRRRRARPAVLAVDAPHPTTPARRQTASKQGDVSR